MTRYAANYRRRGPLGMRHSMWRRKAISHHVHHGKAPGYYEGNYAVPHWERGHAPRDPNEHIHHGLGVYGRFVAPGGAPPAFHQMGQIHPTRGLGAAGWDASPLPPRRWLTGNGTYYGGIVDHDLNRELAITHQVIDTPFALNYVGYGAYTPQRRRRHARHYYC